MKLFLLLAFVAISYASSGSKSIYIGEDGTIDIKGAYGKHVVISKTGEKFIDILVEGSNIPTKRIRINEDDKDKKFIPLEVQDVEKNIETEHRDRRSSKSKTTADLLNNIFKKFEGVADEKSYESLLKKVNEYVESGELDEAILDVLKTMHDQKLNKKEITTEDNVRVPCLARVPLLRSDGPISFRNYILRNYQEPSQYANVAEQRWNQSPEKWNQPTNQLFLWPYTLKSAAQDQQRMSPQQQWAPQELHRIIPQESLIRQQQLVSNLQREITPQQLVPQPRLSQSQMVSQQQGRVPENPRAVVKSPWIPEQNILSLNRLSSEQYIPQDKQRVISQQQGETPLRQSLPNLQWRTSPEQQWVSNQQSLRLQELVPRLSPQQQWNAQTWITQNEMDSEGQQWVPENQRRVMDSQQWVPELIPIRM